jgi:hypothetical protein
MGNDGTARVQPPDDLSAPCAPDVRADANAIAPDNSALVTALQGHVETLKADVERLESMLADERARTSAAISAFAALADRLDALAAERARPWWRRLAARHGAPRRGIARSGRARRVALTGPNRRRPAFQKGQLAKSRAEKYPGWLPY